MPDVQATIKGLGGEIRHADARAVRRDEQARVRALRQAGARRQHQGGVSAVMRHDRNDRASPSCSATRAASAPRWACKPAGRDAAPQRRRRAADRRPAVLAAGQRIAGAELRPAAVDAPDAAVRARRIACWRYDTLAGARRRSANRARRPGRASMRSLELATEAVRRGAVARDRLRAVQQALAAPGRAAAGGRAALHAGALRGAPASSASSTSPARCGPRASPRTCRCARWPT